MTRHVVATALFLALCTLSGCNGGTHPIRPTPDGSTTALCDPPCGAREFCGDDGSCRPQLEDRATCNSDLQCRSGRCHGSTCCPDGIDCCLSDSDCAGEYRCDSVARRCVVGCTVATETETCKASGHCTALGSCVPDVPSGQAQACDRDAMCAGSARCIDGFCCEGPCGGCSACNVTGSEGTCRAVDAGQDPHDACPVAGCSTDGACDGSGACRVTVAGPASPSACPAVACQQASCDGQGACTYEPFPDATECGLGNACGASTCVAGQCHAPCTDEGTTCLYCRLDGFFVCGGC